MSAVADLASDLALDEIEPLRFRGRNDIGERGVVFGGHLLAHMAVAGARAAVDKPIKSAHGLFARPVAAGKDFEIAVDVLHAGRVFASATATLSQDGRRCARALVLLTAPEPDLIRHAAPMPVVDGPDEAVPYADSIGGREVRAVGGVDINDSDAVGPAESYLWVRFPEAPDDQIIAQGLVTHASAGFLIGTAMRPHPVGQRQAHRDISTGIIGHTISFHDQLDARGWLLLANESPAAGRGRAFGSGHVFTESGRLVASFSQEAMIRHFPEGQSAAGRESTIL
jgi:acyl-CoA thioesterase II